ncbi:hypothetical protein GNX18_03700 [Microbulbifer sp. SH-1]|uniref:hypothetical protein n=1 Tax=Microbulbifer sp. SH-1 TaxID=2681547 RepID=UPI001407BE37|nr:hypothetical protein [Microbulbifer sp. SH-1]QIL88967.1 hypothetical protein GNX18_03700 [Microbulbifer sp. SH-1]
MSRQLAPSTPATLAEKQAEYDRIAKQPRNYRAAWYKQFCTLTMREGDIDLQGNHHISSFYKELTAIYSSSNGYSAFDQMPPEVQMALFDMIFNLGATRLRNLFLNFNNAIKKSDWSMASRECHRPDVSPSRNNYVKQLFLSAHNNSLKAIP